MVVTEELIIIILTKTIGIVESLYGAAEALWAVGPISSLMPGVIIKPVTRDPGQSDNCPY